MTVIAYICLIYPYKRSPNVVFVSAMLYLFGIHLYRYIYDFGSYRMDVSGTMMILVIKVSSIAFNYLDGTIHFNETNQRAKEGGKKNEEYKRRSQYAISKIPSPVEYFGYMFYFPQVIAGPSCEYKGIIIIIIIV